jgi:MFS family permease
LIDRTVSVTGTVARCATQRRRSGLALALVCVAQFIDMLGVTIVVVALPSIGAQLQADAGEVQWVVASTRSCSAAF